MLSYVIMIPNDRSFPSAYHTYALSVGKHFKIMLYLIRVFIVPLDVTFLHTIFVALFMKYTEVKILKEAGEKLLC